MRHALAVLAVAGISAGLLPPILDRDDEPCRADLAHFAAPGCGVIASDTSAVDDPEELWGRVECARENRQRRIDKKGDTARTAQGGPQGNAAYRWISVRDGDDFYGERCELGRNNHRSDQPTFALAGEGDHQAVFFSIRLPPRFPISGNAWQSVVQLKQAQPSANGGGSPRLGLQVFQSRFTLHAAGHEILSLPARRNRWVRFVLNVRFSQDPERGSARLLADLNGDGDALDRHERSRRIRLATLKRETEGGTDDGIEPGESIPAHLRVGIYHDDAYDCPAPAGCVVHFDNVQVVDLSDGE